MDKFWNQTLIKKISAFFTQINYNFVFRAFLLHSLHLPFLTFAHAVSTSPNTALLLWLPPIISHILNINVQFQSIIYSSVLKGLIEEFYAVFIWFPVFHVLCIHFPHFSDDWSYGKRTSSLILLCLFAAVCISPCLFHILLLCDLLIWFSPTMLLGLEMDPLQPHILSLSQISSCSCFKRILVYDFISEIFLLLVCFTGSLHTSQDQFTLNGWIALCLCLKVCSSSKVLRLPAT